MSQLYKIDSSRTNCWKTTRDKLSLYLILVITCESISRYLIKKRCYTIRGFHRHPGSRALPYPEALARRGRYGITSIPRANAPCRAFPFAARVCPEVGVGARSRLAGSWTPLGRLYLFEDVPSLPLFAALILSRLSCVFAFSGDR